MVISWIYVGLYNIASFEDWAAESEVAVDVVLFEEFILSASDVAGDWWDRVVYLLSSRLSQLDQSVQHSTARLQEYRNWTGCRAYHVNHNDEPYSIWQPIVDLTALYNSQKNICYNPKSGGDQRTNKLYCPRTPKCRMLWQTGSDANNDPTLIFNRQHCAQRKVPVI